MGRRTGGGEGYPRTIGNNFWEKSCVKNGMSVTEEDVEEKECLE